MLDFIFHEDETWFNSVVLGRSYFMKREGKWGRCLLGSVETYLTKTLSIRNESKLSFPFPTYWRNEPLSWRLIIPNSNGKQMTHGFEPMSFCENLIPGKVYFRFSFRFQVRHSCGLKIFFFVCFSVIFDDACVCKHEEEIFMFSPRKI